MCLHLHSTHSMLKIFKEDGCDLIVIFLAAPSVMIAFYILDEIHVMVEF